MSASRGLVARRAGDAFTQIASSARRATLCCRAQTAWGDRHRLEKRVSTELDLMKQFVFAWACVGALLGLGLFGRYEIPATLLGLFGGGLTLARVQGKEDWPLGKVSQDWSAGILHVLSHLRPPLLLDRR
jgi:hypothetical protein